VIIRSRTFSGRVNICLKNRSWTLGVDADIILSYTVYLSSDKSSIIPKQYQCQKIFFWHGKPPGFTLGLRPHGKIKKSLRQQGAYPPARQETLHGRLYKPRAASAACVRRSLPCPKISSGAEKPFFLALEASRLHTGAPPTRHGKRTPAPAGSKNRVRR
jgi:hypothetical protein